MALPIYSAHLTDISWGGYTIEGKAPDSFVTLTRTGPITSAEVGADRQTQISILPDQSASITISLQQNSVSNKVFADILDDLRTNGRLVIADMTVNDPSGAILAYLRNAHIMEAPEISLGSDAAGNTYDWTFYCEEVVYSSQVATDLSDADRARITASVNIITDFTVNL